MLTAQDYEQLTLLTDGDAFAAAEVKRERAAQNLRLRELAVLEGSFDMLSDPEALAVMLGLARGATDPAMLAARLLDAFGSLLGVMQARPEQLAKVDGMNAARVQMLSMICPMVRLFQRLQRQEPQRIGNSREAESYCLSLMQGERLEKFYVTCVNTRCQILGRRCISSGSLSEVSAYPRLVMETALNYNAHSVLLSHCHPGGTCTPSPEDITSTIQLQQLLNGVGILVLDHIIVAGDRTYSMIQHGDIDYRVKRR